MRKYADGDERRIRTRGFVREWTRSGLLDASQAERLEEELSAGLRRTNVYLRLTLAFFTLVIVASVAGLIEASFSIRGNTAIAAVSTVGAILCLYAAERLIGEFRLYRFGVEEMLAAGGVVLFVFGAMSATSTMAPESFTVALLGAVGGLALYLRYGFVWSALAGMCCLGALPFNLFELQQNPMVARAVSAVLLGGVFAAARAGRRRYRDEWPGDEYGVVQAAALAGVYIVLNVRLTSWDWTGPIFPDVAVGWFYWVTWVLTWVLSAVGLVLGLREKDRPLIVVGAAMAVLTLVTNKPYLGWERHTWDPMLLGVVLVVGVLALRRWLSHGPGGTRHGFTAARITAGRDPVLAVLGAVPFPVRPHVSTPAPPPAGFDGGRSGGGGASGTF